MLSLAGSGRCLLYHHTILEEEDIVIPIQNKILIYSYTDIWQSLHVKESPTEYTMGHVFKFFLEMF